MRTQPAKKWLTTCQVVPKVSAVVPGQADAEPIVIHADHISMVKFASKENADYKMVVEQLQIMALDAEEKVRSRWEAERRADNGMCSHG